MKTNLVVVNQCVLEQLFKLAESLAIDHPADSNYEVTQDLVNLRNNVYVLPAEAERLSGEMMVQYLNLEPHKWNYASDGKRVNEQYATKCGTKTPVGLFRTFKDQIEEIQVEFAPVPLMVLPK